jgi:hypothetical protein
MAVEQYVVVSTDTTDKVIKEGPLLWDGISSFSVGAGLQLITANAAREGGYTRPSPPATVLNVATLRERIGVGLAENRVFLGRGAPTNAEILAQMRLLTKLTTALAKYMLDQTDTTDGT